jgi:galactose mutarotase-like enzyme
VLRWRSDQPLELFPFAHELRTEVCLTDEGLTIWTKLTAVGADPVPVSFGYHPCLRIPASSRASWTVELGAFRRLVLNERLLPTGERVPV